MPLTAGARLRRHALVIRLKRALDAGALMLVAPAGSGKTMALEEAVEGRGGATAWVPCTELERDPGQLLRRIVRALRAAVPGLVDVVEERMATATELVDVRLAMRSLRMELEGLLVGALAIVIDDAEYLDGAEGSLDVIGTLLGVQAAGLAVAVASRTTLPLRLAKLRTAGRLTELGAADLAFTPEECAELLRQEAGREPPEAEVEALWTATEGWPLGAALAARSDRVAAHASPGALFEYLTEELIEPLEPELRDRLIDASAAPDLGAETIAALDLPADFLEQVRQCGLPLTLRAGANGERPRYHPLLREFLLKRLEEERPETYRREVHARIAKALEAADRGAEAVDHWLDAESPERAAEAVARHGADLVRTAPLTVANWLDRVPAPARTIPELQMLEGQLAAGTGRLEEAVGPLRGAVAAYEAQGNQDAAWAARLPLADALIIREDFETAIPLAEGFERAQTPIAAAVAISVAAAVAGACRYRESSEMFERVLAHPAGAAFGPLVQGFHGFWVDLQCGSLNAALDGAHAAVGALERSDPLNRLPYLLGMAAVIEDERGEEHAALATFQRAASRAERTVLSGYIGDIAARFAASVHARSGRMAEAESDLARTAGPGLGWYAGDANLTRAMLAAHHGEAEAAIVGARRAIEAGGLSPWRSRSRNTALLVPLLVDTGRPGWARELVEEALDARPELASVTRLRALRGWLRALEGDEAGGLEDVALAWDEAGEEADHLVRRERPRLEPLLWTALERGTLPPSQVVTALESAEPGGGALLSFTEHPVPEVRRLALRSVAASGHPEAYARIEALESDPEESVAGAARASRMLVSKEPPPLAFSLLGGFKLRRGTHVVMDEEWGVRLRAAQRLVRFLLVHRDTLVPEDDLFEAFWPDATADSARRGLQVTLSSARAVLDFPRTSGSVIEAGERNYRLALVDRDVVDIDEFSSASSVALAASGTARSGLLRTAAEHWTGEPLPEDRYQEWAAPTRARLIDLYAQVLDALADDCSAAGDQAGALDAAARHVEFDPLNEAAHQRLMLGYARSGRRGEALREYLACRRALVDGLGIEPSDETTALQRRVLAGEAV